MALLIRTQKVLLRRQFERTEKSEATSLSNKRLLGRYAHRDDAILNAFINTNAEYIDTLRLPNTLII